MTSPLQTTDDIHRAIGSMIANGELPSAAHHFMCDAYMAMLRVKDALVTNASPVAPYTRSAHETAPFGRSSG